MRYRTRRLHFNTGETRFDIEETWFHIDEARAPDGRWSQTTDGWLAHQPFDVSA